LQDAQADCHGLGNSVEDDRENHRNDQVRLVGSLDSLALTPAHASDQPVAEEERERPCEKPHGGKRGELGELYRLEDELIGNSRDQHPGPESHDDSESALGWRPP
jgi:hypothetical protein